ncbi:hypothetical protein GOP47_0010506 [Adiantum capillus-veneris]|uniref:Uncharacterized protein n=1 Tax=Adiantum capillus-veneris TaxID=13818 RepID=A0A9D4ZIV4_ADICA|nr:hypothetical protein GOP47_0010506 [Adiantum capillus-veneris]
MARRCYQELQVCHPCRSCDRAKPEVKVSISARAGPDQLSTSLRKGGGHMPARDPPRGHPQPSASKSLPPQLTLHQVQQSSACRLSLSPHGLSVSLFGYTREEDGTLELECRVLRARDTVRDLGAKENKETMESDAAVKGKGGLHFVFLHARTDPFNVVGEAVQATEMHLQKICSEKRRRFQTF